MDVKFFMQIEGHRSGNVAADPAHQGWIPLTLATLGKSAVDLMRSSPYARKDELARTGMAAVGVTKDVDSSSAFLYQACASGKVFGKVIVDYCTTKNGKVIRRYMRVTLTNAQILRSRPLRGGDGIVAGEDHVFDAEKLAWVYNP